MNIPSDKLLKIKQALEHKNAANYCTKCSQTNTLELSPIPPIPSIPTVARICSNCGHVIIHSLNELGVTI